MRSTPWSRPDRPDRSCSESSGTAAGGTAAAARSSDWRSPAANAHRVLRSPCRSSPWIPPPSCGRRSCDRGTIEWACGEWECGIRALVYVLRGAGQRSVKSVGEFSNQAMPDARRLAAPLRHRYRARKKNQRAAWFAGFVNTVYIYSISLATPACERLAGDSKIHVKSQRAMLNWHFAIYNKLCIMKYKHKDTKQHKFGHSFVSLMNYVDDQYILDLLPELARHSPGYEIDINFANGQVSPPCEYPAVLHKSIS